MGRALRLCWWGPDDDSALGRLHRAAAVALARQPEVILAATDPDLTVITATAAAATAPGQRQVYFPWNTDVDEWSGPAWAASRWHQKVLGGAPRVAMGAFVHTRRTAPPEDGGIVLLVMPADAPLPTAVLDHLGEGVYPVREAPGGDDLPCLPADPAQRAAVWYDAAAVVLLPGCECSVPLAIEARSAGVPVLVPKGDPADELMLVNGIGAYGVRLGDVPEPDLAALSMRLTRMAGNDFAVREVDLSGWAWDQWAGAVVAEARALVPGDAGARSDGDGTGRGAAVGQEVAVGMMSGLNAGERPRYAIFSLTPVTGNVAMEGLLARVLLQEGFEPAVIRCNGLRQRCTMDMVNPNFASRTALCLNCTISAERFQLAWAGEKLSTVLMDELVSSERLQAAEADLAAVPDHALMAYVFDGMPVGQWVESALRLDYHGENWRALPALAATTRDWLRSLLPVAIAADTLFATERPAGALLLSGVMPWEKVVHTLAGRHGVRCLYYEGGQRPGSMILREDTPACRYDFSPEWREWADVPLSVAESAALDGFVRNRQSFGQGMTYVFSPAASGKAELVRRQLGVRPDHPVVVVYTSVVVDAISYEAHRAFESQAAWLEACVELAERRPEVDVIIRVHPAEQESVTVRGTTVVLPNDGVADVLKRRWPSLPDNVFLLPADDPTSSYDLLALATVVLNYVSTVGLEAAAAGKPVVTAGVSHYSEIGAVWSPPTATAFASLVEGLLANPHLPPDGVEIARRYMYFWFYRCTPVMPGLPHAVKDIVAMPQGPLPYWQEAGSPDGVPRYASYLAGSGPFVPGPLAGRPRDRSHPQPLRAPAVRTVLVWPRGWAATKLVDDVIRPLSERRTPWRAVVMMPADGDMAPYRDLAAEVSRRLGPQAAVTFVADSADDRPIWWAMASAVVPPAEQAADILAEGAAFGVPLWSGTTHAAPALAL
jgi:glycosyltransferase involved in cell wall biosynthesis